MIRALPWMNQSNKLPVTDKNPNDPRSLVNKKIKGKKMGIFSSIKEKLFGKKEEKTAAPVSTASPAATHSGPMGPPSSAAAKPVVDVEALLDAAVAAKGQKLDWRNSIVDTLKALDLDSSLAARKELAKDLDYSGPHADGSAEKNIWLHKALMKALAENGGKIPKELLD